MAALENAPSRPEDGRARDQNGAAHLAPAAPTPIPGAAPAPTPAPTAERAREQLLAEAKQRADRDRDEARRAVDVASQQRIKILEHLMGVYRDLEAVPAALEAAYQERDNLSEGNPETSHETGSVVPLDGKVGAGSAH